MDPFTSTSSPSTWRRSVRRRPTEVSPEEEELARRVEELETEAGRLRREKEAAESEARALRAEVEAERGAAETAASEAMLMIERLQREKAAALMEARQFRRYADRDRELQDELASLSTLAESYLSRLQAHGIDPNLSFSSSDDDEEYSVEHIDADVNGEETSFVSGGGDMEVKGMVVEAAPLPVEKEFEYTIDLECAAKAVGAVEECVSVVDAGDLDLYARVEALEADRTAMRREMAALRAERARTLLARAMARRLCAEAVAGRGIGIVKRAVPLAESSGFSVFAICKWLFSIIFWRKNCSTARFTFGLSTTFLCLLLLLDRSNPLNCWRRLPRLQR